MYNSLTFYFLFKAGTGKKAQAPACTCIQITAKKKLYSKGFHSRVIVLQSLAPNSPNTPAWMFLSFAYSHSAFFRTIISKLLAEFTVDLIKCTR